MTKLNLTESEWQEKLSPEEFLVPTRRVGMQLGALRL